MKNTYKLVWSNEALRNLERIFSYLENRWTNREIKKFASVVTKRIQLIESNPFLFAESELKNLRKSVLSRQTSIYYKIVDNEIRIVTLFDNRQNPKKLID